MAQAGFLLLAFLTGTALGGFYFLNLWGTVNKLPTAANPTAMMITNFGLRMGITLTGFFLVMAGRWERALAAMLGFLLIRQVLVKTLGRQPSAT